MQVLVFLAWWFYYRISRVVKRTVWFWYIYKWHPLRLISLRVSGRAYYKEKRNNMTIVSFRRLVMFDFDTPDKVHLNMSVTYKTKDEVYARIEWVCKAKSLLFWVEQTPGGVHIWLLSERLDLSVDKDRMRFHYLAKVLNCDPLYRRMSLGKRYCSCRVSPKKRPSILQEDRIAKYVGLFGDHSLIEKLCLEDFRYYLKFWSKYQNQKDIDYAYSVVKYLESYTDY